MSRFVCCRALSPNPRSRLGVTWQTAYLEATVEMGLGEQEYRLIITLGPMIAIAVGVLATGLKPLWSHVARTPAACAGGVRRGLTG
jgi:hypothetical protein